MKVAEIWTRFEKDVWHIYVLTQKIGYDERSKSDEWMCDVYLKDSAEIFCSMKIYSKTILKYFYRYEYDEALNESW